MAPKKGKDITASENYWRTFIEEAPLDDDNWKVKVVIIDAAGSDQDRIYINKFECFAAAEKRFVIKNICKSETTFMINQLGGEKKIKDDSLRVFEEGQAYLKEKKDIPPDVLALIIKHLILKMKDEYLFIKRQRLEVREGVRRESTTMVDRTEVRGTVSVKLPESPESSPPAKGKSKKGESEPLPQTPELSEGKKYNTVLRVRGEEWRDKVYVDDFPKDGPNLYVTITGFVEPLLPESLVKIGIPLTAIVQVRIDATTTRVPSSLLRSGKRDQSKTELLTEKSMKFWEDLQHMRINENSANSFKDTAFIVFSPPYWDSESLSGNPDKIYDELCYLMYDIQDLTRQHSHYLENMDIIHIPQNIKEDRCYTYYRQLIQDLPLECATIYSILDSILQTVTNCQDIIENSSVTSVTTALTMMKTNENEKGNENISKGEKLVNDIFSNLRKFDEKKKVYRITQGEEFEQHKDPVVINYGDFTKYSTFHLGNINLDNIVWTSLRRMPIHQLWQNQKRPEGELEAKINFHVNVLLSCFDREDVETPELNRLMHILACRKLFNNRSSLKKAHLDVSTIVEFKKAYLKRSILAEPLPNCPSLILSPSYVTRSFPSMTKYDNSNASYGDDPEISRIKFLFDCPDISELVSPAEIANGQPLSNIMIEDFENFEDYRGIEAFQILLEAYNNFNCVDYKYCEVTDCFILLFFNSHDQDGIAREEWRSHIPTPLCLQDFFDFVFDEQYDWIQNEEKLYDENVALEAQSICKHSLNQFDEKSCIEDMDVEIELLMEGSLKHQEIADINEPEIPEFVDTKSTSKKTAVSPSSLEDSKSSRKTKSAPLSNSKQQRQSFIATGTASDLSIKIPGKPFIGYDLGHRRVEALGQNSSYFSNDGTRVISKYSLTIPNNLEYIILNVVPGNKGNDFWLHRALGKYVKPEIINMCESVRITTRDGMLINLKKQNYEVLLPIMATSSKTTTDKMFTDIMQTLVTRYFHSLLITWPNGLITESVHLDNSPNISHIKQFYNNPLLNIDEEMRCISLNGDVIIFRPSGIIEVLQPDGTFINILKYGKRPVQIETGEETVSEGSDHSKKGKAKDKTKEKTNKPPSKSSKNALNDDNSEIKQPDYELVIEEYETIETNGLRQKWINEQPHTIEKLLIRTATDYCLKEVFSRRMDGTNILYNKDGVQIVTFSNNTRIITQYVVETDEVYPEWTEEEKEFFDMLDTDSIGTGSLKSKASLSQKSCTGTNPHSTSGFSSFSKRLEEERSIENERNDGYISVQIVFTIEHQNFTTITIDKANNKISVDSPNESKVVVDVNNNYDIILDTATRAAFDGNVLNIDYEACPECKSHTTTSIKVIPDDLSSVTKMHQHWLKMNDSFGKQIVVNEEGHISLLEKPCFSEMYHNEEVTKAEDIEGPEEKRNDVKSETSITSHAKCRQTNLAKNIRFLVLNRDLSCSEIVHRSLLEEYMKACRWQPWCSINEYDTFADHRNLLSILTPVNVTESEKWLMESKMANKPKHLTFGDLKTDPGKGFYHWMRPYERFEPKPMKPENVHLPRLPRFYILRTIEQQWKESERENLKGARELLAAILKYRQLMESDCENLLHVPIRDDRSEEERRTADVIQALGHRIYEDMKARLAEDVESRAKPTITTKPLPASSEASVVGEMEEDESDKQRLYDEERESLLKEVEAVAEMSPELKRYWRRREEELNEEKFYKYLLREGSAPPYFRNILGGAIWWEMNDTAGEAAALAETKKQRCTCGEEGTSGTADADVPYM